ncbi:MAG: hypothetical protein NTZ15_14705 [Burkholderiales bacterium]|nr:hypothetical protein [Burkholderiales bacterium]
MVKADTRIQMDPTDGASRLGGAGREWQGWLAAILASLAVMLLALLLESCGGGTVAGVGSGGTGEASGTVSGFGSVIVDGVEYSDTSATVQRRDATGALVNTTAQLGQRVRLQYQGSNAALSIEVVSQLLGSVTTVPDSNGRLQVLGQTVRLVSTSSDATRSTATVLDGYSAASDIAVGDTVDVYGCWVWDSGSASYVLVATRLAKQSSAPSVVQLGGVVQALSGTSFRLNSATGTLVQSSSLPGDLANGQVVQVWATATSLASVPVPATRVLRSESNVLDLASGQSLRLSGLATEYNASARTVVVQGALVQLPSSLVVDTSALAQGQFVSMDVQRVGSTLVASAVSTRTGSGGHDDQGAVTVLMGVTSGIDWTPSTVLFSLRGVRVQAAASVIDNNCRSVALTAQVSLSVEGRLQAPGQPLMASKVTCSTSVPANAVVDTRGQVLSVQTAASSLVLSTNMGNVNATWDSNTYFSQSPATLVGKQVEVQALLASDGKTLQLRSVQLD